MSKKERLLAPIELVSKALHKNKDSIRIRLCGIIAETDVNDYGLDLKRASPNSMKAFFCHFGKNLSFFAFDAFCLVLAHKKAFSIF
ncbi:hypothetical protein MPG43_05500 [Helicobacter pylori]|uniref:hypothetical protein n=1 Tax=Helicobacter pylori TaxID=210 RepID=UPI001FCF995E|nr:hypothetical protein [Helicobacter pylori]UOS02717.1 hypothetical protein MPG43_05500 [Helicobacter pylori]